MAKDAELIRIESELRVQNQMLVRMEHYFEVKQVSLQSINLERPTMLHEFELAREDVLHHNSALETSSIEPLRRIVRALEQVDSKSEADLAGLVVNSIINYF